MALVTIVDEHEPVGASSASYDVDVTVLWKGDPSIEEVTAVAGDGLTAAGDPELFARINEVTEPTHPETPPAEHLLAAIGPARLALMLYAAFCLAVPVGLAIGLRPITRKP